MYFSISFKGSINPISMSKLFSHIAFRFSLITVSCKEGYGQIAIRQNKYFDTLVKAFNDHPQLKLPI
jgi:hypothetical protein